MVSKIKSLKTTHKRTKKNLLGKNYFWMISIVFFLIVIVVLSASNTGLIDKLKAKSGGAKVIGIEAATTKLQNFVDTVYAQSIQGMEILEAIDESGIYSFKVNVTGQDGSQTESSIYTTKDGKFFLVNPIDMDEMMATVTGQNPGDSAGGAAAAAPAGNIPKTDEPKVELFTMSYCPFGNQAEDGLSPVARLLANDVSVEPHYVIYKEYRGGGPQYCLDDDSQYCSLHGIEELKQNVRELCIYKYSRSKFWDYIDGVNKDCDLNNIATCWDGPAKDLGIDTGKIASCLDNEALDLLKIEAGLNEKYGVTGSPTLIINGAKYGGGRAAENYKLGICGAFNVEPEACGTVLGATTAAAAGGCQ